MIIIFLYAIAVIATVILTIILDKKYPQFHFFIKKGLHLVAIFISAFAVQDVPISELFILVSVCLLVVGVSVLKGFLADPITGKKESGVVYFIVAFWILLGISYYLDHSKYLIFTTYSLLVLSISDGLAGIIGRGYSIKYPAIKNSTKIMDEDNSKSWVGLFTFWITSFFIILHFSTTYTNQNGLEPYITAALISMLLAMIEFISLRGLDNITATLSVFFLLVWMDGASFNDLFRIDIALVIASWCVSIFLIYLFLRYAILTFSGALAAYLLAFVVIVLSQQSLIPLICFLLVGSLLGKLPKGQIVSDDRFNKPRNALQVFSNGGIVFILCLLFWLGKLFSLNTLGWLETGKLMVVSVAVCLADTASSELGSRYGGIPFDIVKKRTIAAGVSGGVTWLGTFCGLLGSYLIVFIGSCIYPISSFEYLIFVLIGFLGMLLDSWLGSKYQLKVLVNGVLLDASSVGLNQNYFGKRWMNNNSVNFTSNLFIIIILYIFYVYQI